jgi:hypothetical protein
VEIQSLAPMVLHRSTTALEVYKRLDNQIRQQKIPMDTNSFVCLDNDPIIINIYFKSTFQSATNVQQLVYRPDALLFAKGQMVNTYA